MAGLLLHRENACVSTVMKAPDSDFQRAVSSPIVRDQHGRALRDLRISVTDRCNFRCPYCMPAELFEEHFCFQPREELLSFEEIERVARSAVDLGVTKLRITGGEPLLRKGLPTLIERLAKIDGLADLALTSNGYLLKGCAQDLANVGLNRITISLDSLNDETFRALSGSRFGVEPVLAGIAAAAGAGLGPIKINTVVVRGINDKEVVDIARHFAGTGIIVRFIEFMDVGTLNEWSRNRVVYGKEILDRIHAEMPIEPRDANYPGEVAQRYAYRDGSGEIGIVASIAQPFCGDCTRARLTSDGVLATCLFAESGKDLKSLMRNGASDEELRVAMEATWSTRSDRYSEQRASELSTHRPKVKKRLEMYRLGG